MQATALSTSFWSDCIELYEISFKDSYYRFKFSSSILTVYWSVLDDFRRLKLIVNFNFTANSISYGTQGSRKVSDPEKERKS